MEVKSRRSVSGFESLRENSHVGGSCSALAGISLTSEHTRCNFIKSCVCTHEGRRAPRLWALIQTSFSWSKQPERQRFQHRCLLLLPPLVRRPCRCLTQQQLRSALQPSAASLDQQLQPQGRRQPLMTFQLPCG